MTEWAVTFLNSSAGDLSFVEWLLLAWAFLVVVQLGEMGRKSKS